jgi:hypothetical protein
MRVPPPAEKAGYDQNVPDPEEENVGGDRLGLIAGGLSALGMTYTGLTSFGQYGKLFGDFGEAAAAPMEQVKAFVEEGRRRFSEAEGGIGQRARAVMMSDATDRTDLMSEAKNADDLDQRARDIAEEYQAQDQRQRGLARMMTRQKVETGIAQMADETLTTDRMGTDHVNRLKSLTGLKIRTDVGERRSTEQLGDQVQRAFARIDGLDGPAERAAALMNVPFNYSVDGTQPQRFEVAQPGSLTTSRGGQFPGQGTPETFGHTLSSEANQGRRRLLRQAYQKYKSKMSGMNQTLPDNPTHEELLMRERLDSGFSREVEREMQRLENSGRTTSPAEGEITVGGTPLSQIEDNGGQPLPNFADPAATRAFRDADPSAIAQGLPGDTELFADDNSGVLDHYRNVQDTMHVDEIAPDKAGVVDRLAQEVQTKFNHAVNEANSQLYRMAKERGQDPDSVQYFDFTLEKVRIDEQHHVFQGRLQQGEAVEEFDVPVVSKGGTFKKKGQKQSFTHPINQLVENGLYDESEGVQMIENMRGEKVARADEMAMMKVGNYVNKALNDMKGGRSASDVVKFLKQRLVDESFRAKSKATDVQDTTKNALEMRLGTEQLYEQAAGSSTRREQMLQGLTSIQNAQRLHGTEDRFYASDSEFISPQVMGEAGQSGKAKIPFEVAGAVTDPNSDASLASLEYKADLSQSALGNDAEKVQSEVMRVYEEVSGKKKNVAERKLNTMREGGQLQVEAEGQQFDLLDEAQRAEATDAMDWIPEKQAGEELDSYYMRVQNSMLDRYGASYSVGQNFASAEHNIYSNLSERTGVDLHSSITDKNVIDTMNMAHALSGIPGTSKSLDSVTAAAYDLDTDVFNETRDAYIDAVKEFRDKPERLQMTQGKGEMREAIKEARESGNAERANDIQRSLDAGEIREDVYAQRRAFSDLQGTSGESLQQGQKELVRRLNQTIGEMPKDLDTHTAAFDAYMTGRITFPKLHEYSQSAEGKVAKKRTNDVLSNVDAFLGDRQFAERHGETSYGEFNDKGEFQEGPVPFFSNQAAASMGRGVMMNPRSLPLSRLQNPVRQLYQRFKPKQRLGTSRAASGKYTNFTDAEGTMARRAQLHNQEDDKLLFSGSGQATPRQRQVYGSYAGEMEHAVTSRVAFLPPSHRNIYESRGRTTVARRDAMESSPSVRTEKVDIEMHGQDGQGDMSSFSERQMAKDAAPSMEDWMMEQAEKRNIGGQGPLEQRLSETQRKDLEDAYYLSKIREDDPSGLTPDARKVLDLGIEERIRRAKGAGRTSRQLKREVLGKGRKGDPDVTVGGRTELFNPNPREGIVKDTLLTSDNKRLLGLDAAIERDQGDPSQLVMQFIEDPAEQFKEFTMGAKVGQLSLARQGQVGMAGEQAMMEAAAMKKKRRDFAGLPQYQVGRMHDRAVEALQKNAGSDGATMQQREQILDRFSGALDKMTSDDISKREIRNNVVREKMGGQKFSDYFEVNYTDQFSKAMEEGTSTTNMMSAVKEMSKAPGVGGMTLDQVYKQGSEMLKQFGMQEGEAQQKVYDRLHTQIEETLKRVRKVDAPDLKEEFQHIPKGQDSLQHDQEVKGTIKKLRKQKERLNKLFDNKIETLSNSESTGSLYDLVVDSESGNVSTGFRALASGINMQSSAVGGTSLGEDFEAGVGRATRRKRSSLLTQALVGHSASNTLGALGGRERMAQEVFRGWMSSKSGAAAFADDRFQREVFNALSRAGVADPEEIFDPDRVVKEGGKYKYELDDGKKIPLQSHINDKFEWDADEGMITFTDASGNAHQLDVNPFTTLRDTVRRREQVLGMVTGELQDKSVAGTPVGGDGRTLTLTFGGKTNIHEGRISAEDFHELFGKKTRAQQHYQHEESRSPRPQEERSYNSRYVYFGENAKPLQTNSGLNYTDTVFNEQFDFLEVRLHGDLTGTGPDVQTQEIAQALKKAGVSEDMISRTLMGDFAIKRATSQFVGDLNQQERERVESTVDYMRKSNNTGGATAYLPTKTDSFQPEAKPVGSGVERANVGQWADLADKLDPDSFDSIQRLNSSVKRIKKKAQELKGRGLDLQTSRQAQQELQRTFNRQFKSSLDSGAFRDAEEFFAKTLQKGAKSLVNQMAEMEGTYLGGEFKLSAPQIDMTETFRNLSKKAVSGEPTSEFKEEVASLMERTKTDEALRTQDGFSEKVDQVAKDLNTYVKSQYDKYGDDFNRYRGMGVGEGFISRSKAEQVKSRLETSHRGWERKMEEGTNLSEKAERRLQKMKGFDEVENALQASAAEVRLAEKEINKPGSTPGMLMTSVRHPDFTAAGGYEMSRVNVLGDETIRAIGGDPEHIHTVSHPLNSWSRKEDFDYDLNFMGAVDDTMAAFTQRRTRAQNMPSDLANLWEIMEQAQYDDDMSTVDEGGGPLVSQNFQMENERVQLDTGEGGVSYSTQRATTQVSGDNTFTDGIEQFFSKAGMAMQAAGGGQQARTAYALQKSIVGQFGAYAKQGAVQTRQRTNAFSDMMTRMVQEQDNIEEMYKEKMDSAPESAEQKARQGFKSLLNRPGTGYRGDEKLDAWTFMKDTFTRFDEMDNDKLQKAALAEMEITQAVAIEKYKSGDSQAVSRKMNSVLQTLHGNPSGGFNGFDEAFDALTQEEGMINDNLPFDPENLFGNPEMTRAERVEEAREAFKLQHDMRQSMSIADQAGIGSDYHHYANAPSEELDAAAALGMADPNAERRLQAESQNRSLTEEAARTLMGNEQTATQLGQAKTEFIAAQEFHDRRIQNLIEAPSSYEEKFGRAIKNMPIGAKAAGVAGMAGLAALSVASGPQVQGGGSEQYDLPQSNPPNYRMGNRLSSKKLMGHRSQALRDAAALTTPGPSAGMSAQARRPPTRRSTY